MATATCREAPGLNNPPTAEDGARPTRAPFPERVRLHPDVYALLARWLVEDLRASQAPAERTAALVVARW